MWCSSILGKLCLCWKVCPLRPPPHLLRNFSRFLKRILLWLFNTVCFVLFVNSSENKVTPLCNCLVCIVPVFSSLHWTSCWVPYISHWTFVCVRIDRSLCDCRILSLALSCCTFPKTLSTASVAFSHCRVLDKLFTQQALTLYVFWILPASIFILVKKFSFLKLSIHNLNWES